MTPGSGLAVVGAINVDLVVSSERLPGPGETVVGRGPESFGGGKGANAAVAAARAGAEVLLVGAVGSDQTGDETLAALAGEGIDVGGVARLEGEPTGVALIVVDTGGENQIAVGAGANAGLDAAAVRAALEPRVAGLGCVLVSTEIPHEAVLAAVDVATEAGVRCVVNPAPPTPAVVESIGRGALLTPNVGELEELLGRLGEAVSDGDTAAGRVLAGARVLSQLSGAPAIVTRGGDGVLLVAEDGQVELPAPPAEVVDTTGAGDTFNGVLAARLAAGDELERAAAYGVAAASISVASSGAREGMPTASQIDATL